jgi:hypothetical protein
MKYVHVFAQNPGLISLAALGCYLNKSDADIFDILLTNFTRCGEAEAQSGTRLLLCLFKSEDLRGPAKCGFN